jgi:pimeloyl-ACP methyl ester carboxylesterase
MKPVRKTLSLPDIQLSYLEWNQSQEPLLLLHGAGGEALVWSSLAVTLANRYHIVALDMRGHGESSKPQGNYPYSDADLIADLEAVMVRLGWSSAHVVGHSWMGKLAAIWALQHPERLRSMILVDPVDFVRQPCPIDIPTLFVQPEKGINCTDSHLEPYKTYLKNLRICKVPGNHWPFLVQPEVFNRTVKAFLEEHRGVNDLLHC